MALSLATVGAKITAAFMNLIIGQVNLQGTTGVIPTSAVNGTVGVGGKVTFTAQTTVSVNGCFTSAYDNYRIVIEIPTHVASQDTFFRLRVSGTDATAATTYGTQRLYGTGASPGTANSNSDKWTLDVGSIGATVKNVYIIDVFSPAVAVTTIGDSSFTNVISTSSIEKGVVGLYHSTAAAYDGFTLYTTSGSNSGTIRVYGYNNL